MVDSAKWLENHDWGLNEEGPCQKTLSLVRLSFSWAVKTLIKYLKNTLKLVMMMMWENWSQKFGTHVDSFQFLVKVSLQPLDLTFAIGAICANGDKKGANGNPLAPMAMDLMAPMVHPIAICANYDHHWWSMDQFKWRHFMAMWKLRYPMKVDGTNGDQWQQCSGSIGTNDNLMTIQWQSIGVNNDALVIQWWLYWQ